MKKEMKAELSKLESEIVTSWHLAIGNRNISLHQTMIHIGLCAEYVCRALHIRKHGNKSDHTFHKLILFFRTDGTFDPQIESHLHDLRKSSANSRHEATRYDKTFTNISRLRLFLVVTWYQDYNKMKFKGLKMSAYKKLINSGIGSTLFNLHRQKKITKKSFDRSLKNKNLIESENLVIEKLIRTPEFASLVIDASGSMISECDAVIRNHKLALDAIRGSMPCLKESLYLMQHIFNHESVILNSLTRIDANGKDNIVELNKSNYHPASTTALYDTIFEAITSLIHQAKSFKQNKGRDPEISIAIMTDGHDTHSQDHTPQEIKLLLSELRKENSLKSSVILGWTSKHLNEDLLINLKDDMGFDEYVCFDKSDPAAIRNAFKWWSQLF